jgi:hypothetical protein
VAAVVHRWVDPLAAALGAQPAYSACRRNRAPQHTNAGQLTPEAADHDASNLELMRSTSLVQCRRPDA